MGPAMGALVAFASASLAPLRAPNDLVAAIHSPLVDEPHACGELPRLVALLCGAADTHIRTLALGLALRVGYYGRREVLDALLAKGLVKRLLCLQSSDLGGSLTKMETDAVGGTAASAPRWRRPSPPTAPYSSPSLLRLLPYTLTLLERKDFNNRAIDGRDCEKEHIVGSLSQLEIYLEKLPEGEWFCCSSCSEMSSSFYKIISDGAHLLSGSDINLIRKKHELRCLRMTTIPISHANYLLVEVPQGMKTYCFLLLSQLFMTASSWKHVCMQMEC